MAKSPLDIGAVSSVGDVEFVERLGVGLGSGRFKARLTQTGSVVALLLVESEKYDKAGLLEWARRLKRIDHPGVPGVVQVEDVLEPGFVAQRYIDADSLADKVRGRGALAPVEALAITLQAAAAIRAAHHQELPHGALAARSIRLDMRDGAMDAVRIVGWRPLGPGLTHERAVAGDIRGLGEALFLALIGEQPPKPPEWRDVDPGEAIPVSFSHLADASLRAGMGQRAVFEALAQARQMFSVDDFVDALLPEFIRFVSEAKAEVAYELGADREFKEEVQRQRARQRELESKLRFIKDWLRDNASDVERVDEKVVELEKQERSLRNLEVELAMLLDRPIQPGQTLATARRPAEPTPVAAAPTPVAPAAVPEAPAPAAYEAERPAIPMHAPPPAPAGSGRTLIIAALVAGLTAGVMWFVMRPPAPVEPGPDAPASAGSAESAGSVASVAAASTESAAPPSVAPPSRTGVQTVPTTAPESIAPATAAPVSAAAVPLPAPPGMIYIPAGKAQVALSGDALEKAKEQCVADTDGFARTRKRACADDAFETGDPVEVGAFFIDRLEVSQLEYERCVKRRACKTLKLTWDMDEQPATGVTWQMATEYCAQRDARLPTADEWLRAARSDDGRLYPWGSSPPVEGDEHKANYGKLSGKGPRPSRDDGHKYAAPVGVFDQRGQSPFGVANMGGNVREWTATQVESKAIVAGGGWRDMAVDLRVTRRDPTDLDQVSNDLGFRCAADLPR